jgi:MFS family permease
MAQKLSAPLHGGTRPRADSLALTLGGMLALSSAMGIGRFVYTPILPAMVEAIGLTKSAAGLIASANFAGYLLGAVLLALPRLPGGRRGWFLGALTMGAMTTAGMGLADQLPSFLLLRFLGGVASAFVLVLGSALVLDRLAASGRIALAPLHFAGVGIGIAVSAVVVDALQAADTGWRSLWLATGAIAAMVIPVCAWLVPGDPTPIANATAAVPPARPVRGLARLSLCHGLFGFGYVITATFLVAAVRAAPDAHALETTVWIVVGLSAIPSTAIWGWAGRHWGALHAYSLACLTEAIGVAAGGLWPNAAGALLASILLGGTFMGITALGFVAARELAPEQQRRSAALMTAGFGVGQIIGPIVAGWLLDRVDSFMLPSLMGAAVLVLAAIIAMHAARSLAQAHFAEAPASR